MIEIETLTVTTGLTSSVSSLTKIGNHNKKTAKKKSVKLRLIWQLCPLFCVHF